MGPGVGKRTENFGWGRSRPIGGGKEIRMTQGQIILRKKRVENGKTNKETDLIRTGVMEKNFRTKRKITVESKKKVLKKRVHL